jgi:hypothetical protein
MNIIILLDPLILPEKKMELRGLKWHLETLEIISYNLKHLGKK